MFKYDTVNPKRILNAVKKFLIGLGKKGEVAIPFIETVAEESRPVVTDFINKAGITSEEIANFKTFNEFLTGYKIKAFSGYSIPEDIKADPIFEKYKTQEERDRALIAAQKFLGREKLPVPKDANDKETYDLIFKKLGLPDNENGYQLPTDLQIPKELPIDEALLTGFKKQAHSLGILPNQFSGLYKWYISTYVDAFNKFGEQKMASEKETETNLRQEWGAAYPQNIELAKKVFVSFAGEKEYAEFVKGFGNNPILIRMFANIGKILSEDQLTGKPHDLEMTPDEAQAEINKIRGDLKNPFYDANHPQHKEYLDKVERLTKLTIV